MEEAAPAAEQPEEEAPPEESELDKAKALAEDYKRKWYAVSAEYDNYRKRNFGYALDSASDEKTKAGIDKVIKSFKNILSSLGVEEIPLSVGDEFDESVAEAVMNLPCEEGEKPNTVKQILKKGYRTKDKVIRFAQVMVSI